MENHRIRYVSGRCGLGALIVAGTERGVCFVWLGASEGEGRRQLARELPFAELERTSRGDVARWALAIRGYIDARHDQLDVPLDVAGSAFQKRVWAALRRIPRGRTRSYSEVARSVGSPRGARAVARACAANPVPIVTPCHRVVRSGGELGGYALGVRRKRLLLQREGAPVATD